MNDFTEIWVYLSASPLLHLTLTLVTFQLGLALYRRTGMNPLFNPVLISVGLVVSVLWSTGTTYETFFSGAQFVHFLLGPATVALAIPLYRQLQVVRRSIAALLISVVVGSLTASLSAVGIAAMLGATQETLMSLAPKSVTTPVAMGIAESLGGLPSLTATFVMLTGVFGAMIGPSVLDVLGIKDWPARGLAMGTASHGIGTARALQVNEVAGAFSGLAMGLNALAASILLPLLFNFIF